jgi:hypothetical protein
VPLLGDNVIGEPARRLLAIDRELHFKDGDKAWLAVRAAEDDHDVGVRVGHGDGEGRLAHLRGEANWDAEPDTTEQ